MAYNDSFIDSGELIVSQNTGGGSSLSTSVVPVDDTTQGQIDELPDVIGYDPDIYPSDLDPILPDEPVYRKRVVKVVNGKIVDKKIVYMQRAEISMTGGMGDGYRFVIPYEENGSIKFAVPDGPLVFL